MQISNHVISALLGGIIGVGGSAAFLLPKINELNSEIATRPPILVVDMAKLAVDSVPIGAGEAAIKEHFRNTQSVINKFSKAGFLILARENIISSPHDLMLNEDDLPVNSYLKNAGKENESGSDVSFE